MKKHTVHTRKIKQVKTSWLRRKSSILAIVFAVVLAAGGVGLDFAAHAATANTIYFAPSGGTYTIGQVITVGVREDSGSTGVYSAQASFSYNQTLLQYSGSIDASSSGFSIAGQSVVSGGHVLIVRGSTSAVTGDQLIANVSFTVLAAGTASLTPDPVCSGSTTTNCNLAYDVNINNAITSVTPGSFTLQAPVTQTCPSGDTGTYPNCVAPVTTPPPSTPPSTTTPSSSASSAAATTKSTSTSITPSGSSSSITAPNNTQVQVSTPATIEPATIPIDGVQKIQYYLNNKLVYTANSVPYSYSLNTKKLLNGTYTLTSVTYYISGRKTTTTQKLVIKNPFSFIQFGLLLRHYIFEILIPLILIMLAIGLLYYRIRNNKWYKGPGNSHLDKPSAPSTPSMNVQGPTIVTPSAS